MTFLYSGEYYCDVVQRAILNRAVLPLAPREVEYTNARSLHWCAARDVRRGERWGRITSRAIAVLMIFGFPIGALIAGWKHVASIRRAATTGHSMAPHAR